MDQRTQSKKQEILTLFSSDGKPNSGLSETQIALFTYRIQHLTQHLNLHKKDHATRKGLIRLVGKRKKLLNYLQKIDIERYRAVLKQLELRK